MSTTLSNPMVKRVLHVLVLWAPLWIGTTFLFGLVGVGYAFVLKADTWLASQAFIVRDEANGAVMRLGRFESQSQMKASQETILEMSKNHQVVRDALASLGPESNAISWFQNVGFPTNAMVARYALHSISVHAPKGTEFGVSEVIYLDTKLSTPERAIKFNNHLCDALEERLRQVRKSRAESIIAELTHARDAARISQTEVTRRLQDMETKAGLELSDLRGMTDMVAGGTNSRTQIDQIKSELRGGETQLQQLENDIALIKDAIKDPSGFLVTPSELVNTQPGLKKLREGYADAQINASQLSGRFTDQHPLLIAAKTSQSSIRDRLIDELHASLTNRQQELKLLVGKQERLKTVLISTESKLGNIAVNRAEYANIISEVKTRTAILESAERELAEATASSDASLSTSLITRLDQPVISDKPIGPGRITISGLSAIAGLIFGLGLVFVLVPSESGKSFGRRLGDLGFGRRQEDKTGGQAVARVGNQRASDQRPSDQAGTSPSPALPDRRAREPLPTGPSHCEPSTSHAASQVSTDQSEPNMAGSDQVSQRLSEHESLDQIFRELSSSKISITDQAPSSPRDNSQIDSSQKLELVETNGERRQHPRSTVGKSAAIPSFAMRPSGKKKE